jgi:hypothetical protein
MATVQECARCVGWLFETKSVTQIQRNYSKCHVTSKRPCIPSQIPRIACGGRSFLPLVLPVSTGRLSLVTPSNPPPCLKFYFCVSRLHLALFEVTWHLLYRNALASTFTRHNTTGFIFLWGYVKSNVFRTLVNGFDDLKSRIRNAIPADMLHRIWQEFEYRVDVLRATKGTHIEVYWSQ